MFMSDEKENYEMVIDEEDSEEEEESEANLEDLEEDKFVDEKEAGLEGYMDDLDLSGDFSDFDDFDLEELQDIKDAIAQVKHHDDVDKVIEEDFQKSEITDAVTDSDSEMDTYLKEREALSEDFSDLQELDIDELSEMKDAIASVSGGESGVEGGEQLQQVVSDELEEKIRIELEKRKKIEKAKEITAEDFGNYVKEKREKIWFHALYYLVFETNDHSATKEGLYDVLKEVTSKNAIDPIPQQQFYFGLGYILRLKMYDKDIVRYKGGKFTININVENLRKILEENGEPISRRPIITEEKQKEMISDFLKDEFLDL